MDIKKNEAKIRLFASKMESMSISNKEQKVMHLASDDKLAEVLHLRFVKKMAQNSLVSRPILREKMHTFQHCSTRQFRAFLSGRQSVLFVLLPMPRNMATFFIWRVSCNGSALEPFKQELRELIKCDHELLTSSKTVMR